MISPVPGATSALLYVAHRVPYPPDKGDRIRTYHLLRHLAAQGPVDLACLADEPVTPAALEALSRLCRRVEVIPHQGLGRWLRAGIWVCRGRSISEGVFFSPRLAQVLDTWARTSTYHTVLTSASSLEPYLDLPVFRQVPVVVDLMDVDSQKWLDYASRARGLRRLVYQFEARRVRAIEARLTQRARALLVVSSAEAELFRRSFPDGPVAVIENGVDLDYFSPAERRGQGCAFVGALDYWPNVDAAVWFCREVWPEVHRRHPEATVRLVGRRPVADVLRLAELAGVEVVGQVPDVRPHVEAAAVAIAPLRIARGVQNKVLEGMAMARPVLASPQALQGLRHHPVLPVIEARTIPEWVEQLSSLFSQPERCQELGRQGRVHVEAHHSWDACLAPLDRLLTCGRRGRESAQGSPTATG